ncbi:MAG: hypothetical protein GNW80_09955 [Asgard group archaeon]|nr:hypothetical protein [Asgard group archaeon]
MGISYRYAKYLSKLGTRMLIALLVIDTAWTLIRFIVIHTTFGGNPPATFEPIEKIVTNSIYLIFIVTLAVGMILLGFYYLRFSKFGVLAATLLVIQVGIKIAYIFFRITELASGIMQEFLYNLIQIFDLSTTLLIIVTFITFDIFQNQLRNRAGIGYGRGPLPYLFGFFALVYPISNILNLVNIDYTDSVALIFMHMFSYIAAILQIIVYFDLLRRFDNLHPLPDEDEDSIIEIKTLKKIRAEEKESLN